MIHASEELCIIVIYSLIWAFREETNNKVRKWCLIIVVSSTSPTVNVVIIFKRIGQTKGDIMSFILYGPSMFDWTWAAVQESTVGAHARGPVPRRCPRPHAGHRRGMGQRAWGPSNLHILYFDGCFLDDQCTSAFRRSARYLRRRFNISRPPCSPYS